VTAEREGRAESPPASASATASPAAHRLLIALDIDGTILDLAGEIPEATAREVVRLRDEGHEVMLATGRSWVDTKPVADRLGLVSRFMVSANGAATLERDAAAETESGVAPLYARRWVETFDPRDVLERLQAGLEEASFAVEGADGVFRFSGSFPAVSFEARGREVPFDELLHEPASRVVVIAPDQTQEDFMRVIDRIGLHHVSYSVGWTAWLDIAPKGVNKAAALERARAELGIPRSNVVAIGDGRNDVEMLEWASAEGRGFAMGDAPQEVVDAGNRLAPPFDDDGLARALATLGRGARAVAVELEADPR